MRILVNGEQVDVDTSNLREILVELGYQPEDIVVARNLEFIPRAQWDDCVIDEQDSLDILAAMFGG